jgi:tetratricopeptide (TPR) repeat protein
MFQRKIFLITLLKQLLSNDSTPILAQSQWNTNHLSVYHDSHTSSLYSLCFVICRMESAVTNLFSLIGYRLIGVLLCYFLSFSAYAQQATVSDTIEAYQTLVKAKQLEEAGQYDSCMYYFQRSAALYRALYTYRNSLPKSRHTAIDTLRTAAVEKFIHTKMIVGWYLAQDGQVDSALRLLYPLVPVAAQEKENPRLLTSIYNAIGAAHDNASQYDSSLYYYQQCLQTILPYTGENDQYVANFYNNIGITYQYIGELDLALQYKLKGLAIRKRVLPPMHPHLAMSYNNIGSAYDEMGEQERALEYYFQALHIYRSTRGSAHPSVGRVLHNIGQVYYKQGDSRVSLTYMLQAHDILAQALGGEHPFIGVTCNSIGIAYSRLPMIDSAVYYFQRALTIFEQTPNGNPDDIGGCHINLGNMARDVGHYEKAMQHYQLAEKSLLSLSKPYKSYFGKLHHVVGTLHEAKGEYQTAIATKP